MFRTLMKSKLHRATVTAAELDYVGSLTLDPDLMDAAGLLTSEQVQVVDLDNGARFETYVIAGDRGTGQVCLNGAAARLVHPGDRVIIMSYGMYSEHEARQHTPTVVLCDMHNRPHPIDSEAASTTVDDLIAG